MVAREFVSSWSALYPFCAKPINLSYLSTASHCEVCTVYGNIASCSESHQRRTAFQKNEDFYRSYLDTSHKRLPKARNLEKPFTKLLFIAPEESENNFAFRRLGYVHHEF
jgi:hypothetical protein